ncbi:MAG: hypothetical protein ABR600_00415 [Actinomycetota bacterium]
MPVWDVLGKRTEGDEFSVVGGVKAPDAELALLLARESHFRHKEGVAYAVRLRGDDRVLVGRDDAGVIGGATDRSYRRQEAYAGVGAKLKRIAAQLAERGLRIDAPRPRVGRGAAKHDPHEASEVDPQDTAAQLSPEDLAAHGTAG